MGKVTLSLTDEAEQKLRDYAENHKRTLAAEVEHALDQIEEPAWECPECFSNEWEKGDTGSKIVRLCSNCEYIGKTLEEIE